MLFVQNCCITCQRLSHSLVFPYVMVMLVTALLKCDAEGSILQCSIDLTKAEQQERPVS